jgi:hypothetical protein
MTVSEMKNIMIGIKKNLDSIEIVNLKIQEEKLSKMKHQKNLLVKKALIIRTSKVEG